MSAYDELNEHVRRVVDENAEAAARRHGITVEEAREDIAARVVTKSSTYSNGTGH